MNPGCSKLGAVNPGLVGNMNLNMNFSLILMSQEPITDSDIQIPACWKVI